MFDQLDDTITAISSPVGNSVRGIIRLSGPNALALANTVFICDGNQPITEAPAYSRTIGRVSLTGLETVPAEAYTFRAPASYTRQDVVELHLVGSPPILAMLLESLIRKGARPAEPGEFTARAYFSGAMDLTRVEGVAAVIHARNDSQLRASEALLHGKLGQRSNELRDRLADLLSLIEAEIDFSTEPIDFITPAQLIETIDKVSGELESLLRNTTSVEQLAFLPEVILVGPPNAGKSTLFNQLTGMDRAIQSATAGTTRDVLRAPLSVPGGEVTLMDSAGLSDPQDRQPEERHTQPGLIAEKIARRALATADAIILVVDVTNDPVGALSVFVPDLQNRTMLIVANKIDALPSNEIRNLITNIGSKHQIIAVSAIRDEGTELLREEIGKMFFSGLQSHVSDALALSYRQINGLADANSALSRARRICESTTETAEHSELLALEIREAINSLSLLTGEVATEDLLARIFSRFCIGK